MAEGPCEPEPPGAGKQCRGMLWASQGDPVAMPDEFRLLRPEDWPVLSEVTEIPRGCSVTGAILPDEVTLSTATRAWPGRRLIAQVRENRQRHPCWVPLRGLSMAPGGGTGGRVGDPCGQCVATVWVGVWALALRFAPCFTMFHKNEKGARTAGIRA